VLRIRPACWSRDDRTADYIDLRRIPIQPALVEAATRDELELLEEAVRAEIRVPQ